MFLNRQLNPIYVPSMSFEEYERLELRSDTQIDRQRYLWRHLHINGKVDGDSADLDVEIRLKIEATGDQMISIPLGMDNFHRRSAPEFLLGDSQKNSLAVTIDEETGGYVLLASVRKPTEVAMRMKMIARVESDSGQSLQCRFPSAPVSLVLTTDRRDAIAEVIGRGDEVVQPPKINAGRTEFTIESSGGIFTVRWDTRDRRVTTPFLETNSAITLQWATPQEQMIQNVLLTVRNSRGTVSGFELRLPPDASFYGEDPKLSPAGQYVTIFQPDPVNAPELYRITIPEQERQQRVDLEMSIQIPNDGGASEKAPLMFQVPQVELAPRQVGKIQIATGTDYRLQWGEQPYVENTTTPPLADSPVESREYEFEFSRASFALPLWLIATERQLDVTSRCDIEFNDQYAIMKMRIEPLGTNTRASMLRFDLAGWEFPQISDASTGAPVPWYRNGELIEIEMPLLTMEEIAPILIRAQRNIPGSDVLSLEQTDPTVEESERNFRFAIPKVVNSTDRQSPVTLTESLIRMVSKGRTMVIVDLGQSQNLERVYQNENSDDDSIREFRVTPSNADATLQGILAEQPPRISLSSVASVMVTGENAEAKIQWELESKTDLNGQLGIQIPEVIASGVVPSWTVTVNDQQEASIRRVGDENSTQYEIVADSLGAGRSTIDFRYRLPLESKPDDEEFLSWLVLPRPDVDDLTLQSSIKIDLVGDKNRKAILDGHALEDQIELSSLPSEALRMRFAPRVELESELQIELVFIRSAINESLQHDQLLANVVGQGEFTFRLQDPENTGLKVTLDGEPATLSRVDRLFTVTIPEKDESLDSTDEAEQNASSGRNRRLIDIQLWHDRSDTELFPTLEPLIRIDAGPERLLWQLTVPPDRHLVWAKASAGRIMQWVPDRWYFVRKPIYSDATLTSRFAGAEPTPLPAGNRYMFSAMDGSSFHARTGSRTVLWLFVAGTIVIVTSLLTYIPATRTPIVFALGMMGFGCVLAVAPDAAIIIAQISTFAIIVVVIMLALRSLVVPSQSRVLTSTRPNAAEGSAQITSPSDYRSPSSIAVTRTVNPDPMDSTPSEVAS